MLQKVTFEIVGLLLSAAPIVGCASVLDQATPIVPIPPRLQRLTILLPWQPRHLKHPRRPHPGYFHAAFLDLPDGIEKGLALTSSQRKPSANKNWHRSALIFS